MAVTGGETPSEGAEVCTRLPLPARLMPVAPLLRQVRAEHRERSAEQRAFDFLALTGRARDA